MHWRWGPSRGILPLNTLIRARRFPGRAYPVRGPDGTDAADPWLQQDRRKHVSTARRLRSRVPRLRRRVHRGTVLFRRADRAADSAATDGYQPWLPGRVVQQHVCAPAVRPRYGMRDGRVRLATEAWGLVFKNLVSDVGATIYSMNKYRDPPLPAPAVRYKRRQSAG